MTIKGYIVSLFVIGMFMSGVIIFVGELANTFGLESPELEKYEILEEAKQNSQDLQENLETSKVQTNPFTSYIETGKTVLKTTTMAFTNLNIFQSFATDINEDIGFPPAWFTNALISILAILVVMGLVGAITRWRF